MFITFSKNTAALANLAKEIEDREIYRVYWKRAKLTTFSLDNSTICVKM